MRSSTAQNHLSVITSRMESEFRAAIFYRPNLDEMIKKFNNVFSDYKAWAILPQWVKDSAWNHRRELMQRINREYVLQLYVLESGDKIIARNFWDSVDENTRQFVRDGGKLPIKTFWLQVEETVAKDGTVTRVSRPTNDVYFESAS